MGLLDNIGCSKAASSDVDDQFCQEKTEDYSSLIKKEQWREKKTKNDERDGLLILKGDAIIAISTVVAQSTKILLSLESSLKKSHAGIGQSALNDITAEIKKALNLISNIGLE